MNRASGKWTPSRGLNLISCDHRGGVGLAIPVHARYAPHGIPPPRPTGDTFRGPGLDLGKVRLHPLSIAPRQKVAAPEDTKSEDKPHVSRSIIPPGLSLEAQRFVLLLIAKTS